MAIIDSKHKLRAKIGNTSLEFLDKDALFHVCHILNGKVVTITIDDNPKPISPDLYAFYFGIIIRKECMSSEAFRTYYDEMELHNMFASKLRSYIRMVVKNGKSDTERKVDDVLSYDDDTFKLYIEDLKWYLEQEFNIIIKDYETYHIDKLRLTKR